MKKLLRSIFHLSILLFFGSLHAQIIPSIEWQKSFGGSGDDEPYSIQLTSDGGSITAGYSFSNDVDIAGNHGEVDVWLIRLDAAGNLLWQKCLGGSDEDYGSAVEQTNDGGFIVGGYSESNDGDVSGNHGGYDFWIVKLDANGNLLWQKSLGGSGDEKLFSIHQTSDGGYIAAGLSYSNDGDVTVNHGLSDYWVVKLSADGNMLWQKSLGGSSDERIYSIVETTDGKYVAGGWSDSNDGDVTGHHGSTNFPDYWIVKLNANGNLVWQKSLGGSYQDLVYSLRQTNDGGFIIGGASYSNDGNVSGNHGDADYWVVKLNSSGNLTWQKSFGGSSSDLVYFVQQTADSGYVVAGWSNSSNDGNVTGNHGGYDYWILKLDKNGNLLWQKPLGGSNQDRANSIKQTPDGGFIIAGYSNSNDSDVSGNHGSYDYWIVKLSCECSHIATSPVSGAPFCPEAIVNIPFTSSGSFSTMNIYTAELSDKLGNFSAPAAIGTLSSNANSGTITATIPSKPTAGTKYRIRVSSSEPIIIGHDNGANLELVACAKVSAISVLGLTSSSSTINWSAVSCAVKYKVQYRVQGTSTWTSKYSTTNSYSITGLTSNTVYEYHLETYCSLSGSSNSGYTTIQTFATTMRVGSGSVAPTEMMSIYPNPADDQAVIQYSLPQSTHLYINVYDLSGQEIETLLNDDMEQGDHSVLMNTTHFSNGVYFVKLISHFGIEIQKLIVQ